MLHQRRLLSRADPLLLIIVALLLTIGMVMIYSSTRSSLIAADQSPLKKVKLQAIWLVIGLIAMIAAAMLSYEKVATLAVPILGVVVVLLLIVLVIGKLFPDYGTVRGTLRWIAIGPINIQPSELAKLAVIIALSTYLVPREDEVDTLSLVSRTLAYAALPAGLIFLQPDLGTPVVLMFIAIVTLYAAGARVIHIGSYVLVAVLLFSAAWNLGVIRPHQKARLTAFLHPDEDPQGKGYHLKQSMMAIGSGGTWGQGLGKGKQTQLQFIPDQETDFVFTAVGEETGFAGGLILLLLYVALLWRTIFVASQARDQLGQLMSVGVAALFFIHVVVNVGMTIGLMPVKGMPLPFVSYGGSNLVTNMICVGLLENIYMRRHKIAF